MNKVAVAETSITDMIQLAVRELSKIAREEEIAALSKQYLSLTISGLNDRKGFDAVHTARIDVKTRRVAVEKRRKELKADALLFGQKLDAAAKHITGLLAPIEEHLDSEEKKVTDELARIKKEAEEREAARIQARVDKLFDLGCRFSGQAYSLTFAPDGYSVPHALLKECNDEQFEGICQKLQDLIDAEAVKIAAEIAARKAEDERLRKIAEEQEAERKRLEAIAKEQAEEQARIRAEQEEREGKIREEQAAIEREKQAVADAKAKEDAEKRRKTEIAEAEKIAAEKARIEAEAKAKREAEEKAEAEAEAKRFEQMRPDKEKLLKLADALDAFELPTLKHKKPIAILTDVKDQLQNTARFIREEVGQLKPRKGKEK